MLFSLFNPSFAIRKLSGFFKRSSSTPQRGRGQEQCPSSSTSAARPSNLKTTTSKKGNPALLSESHSPEALSPYQHFSIHNAPFSSAPALIQTSSPASPLPADSPFNHRPPRVPTSSLRPSDVPLSSNTSNAPPAITTTFVTASISSRPSTPSSMATSTRSAPPRVRIRIDRNASPARPETRNNVAPFVSDPTLLAPTLMDRPTFASPPIYSRERAERRRSHVPGGTGRSHIPGGMERNFLPGTGDVGTGSGMGMGPGMGLAGITSGSRSRPATSGSASTGWERDRRKSSRRPASVSSASVDASEPGPFARSGEAAWRARVNNFE